MTYKKQLIIIIALIIILLFPFMGRKYLVDFRVSYYRDLESKTAELYSKFESDSGFDETKQLALSVFYKIKKDVYRDQIIDLIQSSQNMTRLEEVCTIGQPVITTHFAHEAGDIKTIKMICDIFIFIVLIAGSAAVVILRYIDNNDLSNRSSP